MESPQIVNIAYDKASGVTYRVKAYRNLSPEEFHWVVRTKLSLMKKSERPHRGGSLTFDYYGQDASGFLQGGDLFF